MAAFEADRVVVELIAKVDQFDGRVEQSAAKFDGAMDRISSAATKAEGGATKVGGAAGKASGDISRFSQAIKRDFTDVGSLMVSDKSPFVVPVKAQPQVSSALSLMMGSVAGLGATMGAVAAGAALSLVTALGALIFKSDETGESIEDLVQKLKDHAEKTDRSREAQEIFESTLAGVQDALRRNQEALDENVASGRSFAEQALFNAHAANLRLQSIRDTTAALLAQAEAEFAAQRARASGPSQSADIAALGLAERAARVNEIRAGLAETDAAIAAAGQQIRQARSLYAAEAGSRSPLENIRRTYEGPNGLIEQARRRALAEGTVTAELTKQIRALKEQQRAEEEAERKRTRKPRATRSTRDPNQQSGRQITEAEARAIVESIGGTPTSGRRTPEHNARVGGVANSFHLTGNALDIAKTAGLTLGKIVEAFAKQGISLIEKLDEGDHFHIAWRNRGAASPEALARKAEQERDKEVRQQNAFNAEMADIQTAIIEAGRGRAASFEEQLAVAEQDVVLERDRQNAAYAAAAAEEKITDAQAQLLVAANNRLATARTLALYESEGERKARVVAEVREELASIEVDRLEDEYSQARTAAERRDLALELLDAEMEIQRIALQRVIDTALIGSAEHQIAQLRLAELNRLRSARASQILSDPAHQSPGERFRADLQKTAGEMIEALEEVEIRGLERLEDGLVDAITGVESLGDAFRNVADQIIADLVRIAVQQAIVKPIADFLFGGGLGGLFGGGGATGAISEGGAVGNWVGPRAASGGPVSGGQAVLVGEHGKELFVPGQDGMIIPNNRLLRMGSGGGTQGVVRIEVAEGALFEPRIRSVSGDVSVQVVRAATPGITDMAAAKTRVAMGRPRL